MKKKIETDIRKDLVLEVTGKILKILKESDLTISEFTHVIAIVQSCIASVVGFNNSSIQMLESIVNITKKLIKLNLTEKTKDLKEKIAKLRSDGIVEKMFSEINK